MESNSTDGQTELPAVASLDAVIQESRENLAAAAEATAPGGGKPAKRGRGRPRENPPRNRGGAANAAAASTSPAVTTAGFEAPPAPFIPTPAGFVQPIEAALDAPVAWMRVRFQNPELQLEGRHELAVQADSIVGGLLPEVANTKWGAITALACSLAFAYGGLYLGAKQEFERKKLAKDTEEAKAPEKPALEFPTVQAG